MQSEMRKEILTREKIKIDIKNACSNDKKCLYLQLIWWFLIPQIFLCVCLFLDIPTFIKVIFIAIIVFDFLLSSYEFIPIFLNICNFLSSADKNQFDIKTDKLLYTTKKEIGFTSKYQFGKTIGYEFSKPYRLYFSFYKEYKIPKHNNYKWSEAFEINDKGIFNYSVPGDEFYLVIMNSKEIVMAYNTKFFKLQD